MNDEVIKRLVNALECLGTMQMAVVPRNAFSRTFCNARELADTLFEGAVCVVASDGDHEPTAFIVYEDFVGVISPSEGMFGSDHLKGLFSNFLRKMVMDPNVHGVAFVCSAYGATVQSGEGDKTVVRSSVKHQKVKNMPGAYELLIINAEWRGSRPDAIHAHISRCEDGSVARLVIDEEQRERFSQADVMKGRFVNMMEQQL